MTMGLVVQPVSDNLAAALAHVAAGRPVFPCRQDKRPYTRHGFKDATTDESQVRAWWAQWPDALIGMPTGRDVGIWALDVDVRDDKGGEESLDALSRAHGALPETVESITASGGRHLLFRHPRGEWKILNRAEELGPGLDVRGDGGYIILPPSRLADGRSYEWEASSDPDEGVAAADAPAWLLELVGEDQSRRPAAPAGFGGTRRNSTSRTDADSALAAIDPDCSYDDWLNVGMALHATGAIWAFDAWDAWSSRGAKYPEDGVGALLRKWESFSVDRPGGIGPGTLFALAKARGWERPRPTRSEGPLPPGPPLDAYADGEDIPPDDTPDLRLVGGTDYDARPEIQIRNGEMHLAVDATEGHLIRSDADIYQHGTRLVRVGRWESHTPPVDEKGQSERRHLTRPSGSGVLVDITPEWLVDQASRCIKYMRYDKRASGWKPVDCPSRAASALLSRAGEWRFPVLTGFCDSPTLDLSGRVVASAGYDAPSGLYLSHPPELPTMGATSRADAVGAGEVLIEAISTFPFVSVADVSACMAAIMTALMRRVLPAAPIIGVSASTPGTGKSKLVDVICAIATGRSAAVVGIGHTPEELEKRVDAVLLKGDALASFDNVDRPVKSDVLCQVSTQATKTIRVLGLSKTAEAPTNVCLAMTGNNLTLIGDLVRRCLLINLDAGCERPELRVFERDAVDYVLKHRAKLIAAALAISRAYLAADSPSVDAPPFGSFEHWDRRIRCALIWAGFADPLRPAEAMRDQDHELAGMRDMVSAWRAAHPDPLTAATLSKLIREMTPQMGDRWVPAYQELTDAATQVMGDLNKWGSRELGYKLRQQRGRIFSQSVEAGEAPRQALRIIKAGETRSGVLWAVETV